MKANDFLKNMMTTLQKFHLILIASFLAFSCSSYVYADINEILAKGYVTVAVYSQDSFPFFFHDDSGKLSGFDIDIAQEIAGNLGVKLIFNRDAKTFDSLTSLLVSKKADLVISWFSRTLERAKKIEFSKPYFIDRQCLLINRLKFAQTCKTNAYLKELNHHNIIIGTVISSSYAGFLKNLCPRARIKFYNNWNQCYQDVIDGRIMAGIGREVSMLALLDAHSEAALKVKLLRLPFNDYICIGIDPTTNKHLSNWINVFLRLKNYHFTPDELIEKYKNRGSSK